MKKMKLSTKIFAGFSVLLIMLVIVGGIGYIKIGSVKDVVADLTGVHMPLVDVVNAIDSAATGQELAATQYALHKDEEFLTVYNDLNKAIDEALANMHTVVKGDEDLVEKGWLTDCETIAETHDVFVAACDKLIEAIRTDQPIDVWDPLADKVLVDGITRRLHDKAISAADVIFYPDALFAVREPLDMCAAEWNPQIVAYIAR